MISKPAWAIGVCLALVLPARLLADPGPPPTPPVVGVWQVYDDKTGHPNGAVRLYVQDGRLNGVVARLREGSPPDTQCTKCPPPQKSKPVLGLVVLWGLRREGNSWTDGTIMDPETGDTYRCTVRLVSPDRLEVRGYVGVSLFGRTQTWVRTR